VAIPRIDVLQYQQLGKKMIEWAINPDTRPKDLKEFEDQTAGMIGPIPARIKGLQFVQSNLEILLIRLPPAEMVSESLDRTSSASGNYPFPPFYEEHFVAKMHQDQKALLEFRVGDYTMAQCV